MGGYATINNLGEIIYNSIQSGPWKTYSTINGDLGTYYHDPSINDLGEMVYTKDGQIYSNYRGQLTTRTGNYCNSIINNDGLVIYTSKSGGNQILISDGISISPLILPELFAGQIIYGLDYDINNYDDLIFDISFSYGGYNLKDCDSDYPLTILATTRPEFYSQYSEFNPDLIYVPEPSTILLIGAGLVGLVGARRKLKK